MKPRTYNRIKYDSLDDWFKSGYTISPKPKTRERNIYAYCTAKFLDRLGCGSVSGPVKIKNIWRCLGAVRSCPFCWIPEKVNGNGKINGR